MPGIPTEADSITHEIIGAGMKVHRALGAGLLERPYETCLVFELEKRGLQVDQQRMVPLVYEGVTLDCVYRLDIVVNKTVIVEVKAIESITDMHVWQMLTASNRATAGTDHELRCADIEGWLAARDNAPNPTASSVRL